MQLPKFVVSIVKLANKIASKIATFIYVTFLTIRFKIEKWLNKEAIPAHKTAIIPHTTVTKSADTTPEGSTNEVLTKQEGAFRSLFFEFVWEYGDAPGMLAFSKTCRAALLISSPVLPKSLLRAVVYGDEDAAKKVVTSRPELLLDSSAIVKDLSGKEIKNLTPLQAAIYAGDVDMVQMIKDVLYQKLQDGVKLNFDPDLEIQRQFTEIYPNGVDSVETEQKAKAQKFKTSNLNDIFTAINTATDEEIKFELGTPGQNDTTSPLNTALHAFRKQFTATANQEQIFNPFYLLSAFEFYNEKFDNFNDGEDSDKWNRRNLFWQQVAGYVALRRPRAPGTARQTCGNGAGFSASREDGVLCENYQEKRVQIWRTYLRAEFQAATPSLPAAPQCVIA